MKSRFLRLSAVPMMLNAITLAIVLAASLLWVSNSVNADEFWRTDLATHEPGDVEVQTRAYLFYDNYTEDSVELGYVYLYSKVISGCVQSAQARVKADGILDIVTLPVEPDLCETDDGGSDHTHHWGHWDGAVVDHHAEGSTIVMSRVYTGEAGQDIGMGWDMSFGDDLHRRDDCVGYCVSFDD